MKLLVGLGNPGKKYERNRHNLGFLVVDQFLKDYATVKNSSWNTHDKFKADIAEIGWQSRNKSLEKIILAKPLTYMNNSGMAVQLLMEYYKIPSEDIWIAHDDVDLPLGHLRIRFGGGTAGHKGIESLLEGLKTDKFWRFRLGIGRPQMKSGEYQVKSVKGIDDFVLGDFTGNEWAKMREMIKHTVSAMETALEEDISVSIHKFNTK